MEYDSKARGSNRVSLFFYSRLLFAKKTLYIMKGSELNGYSL